MLFGGDFDGDGKRDYLDVVDRITTGALTKGYLLVANAAGTQLVRRDASHYADMTGMKSTSTPHGVADFDSDGLDDLKVEQGTADHVLLQIDDQDGLFDFDIVPIVPNFAENVDMSRCSIPMWTRMGTSTGWNSKTMQGEAVVPQRRRERPERPLHAHERLDEHPRLEHLSLQRWHRLRGGQLL